MPQSTNLGKFGYTGQAWVPEVGLWYYKARFYRPDIARFMQTDPIGYEAGPNLHTYVLNDPINFTDPLGLDPPNVDGGDGECNPQQVGSCADIPVTSTFPAVTGNVAALSRSGGIRSPGAGGTPKQCKTDTAGAKIRMVGGWITAAGQGAEVVGAAVTVAVPPAGGAITSAGGLLDFGGNLLTVGGYLVDSDWAGALGHAFDATVGRVTGRQYQNAAKGPWRGSKGFIRNPLGGKYRDAKKAAADIAATQASEEARKTLIC